MPNWEITLIKTETHIVEIDAPSEAEALFIANSMNPEQLGPAAIERECRAVEIEYASEDEM